MGLGTLNPELGTVFMDRLIDVAKGVIPADLLLKNARMVNVFTREIYPTNVAIAGEWIAGVAF